MENVIAFPEESLHDKVMKEFARVEKEAKKTMHYIAEIGQLVMELQSRLTFKTQTIISDEQTLDFLKFIVRFFDLLPPDPVLDMDLIGMVVRKEDETISRTIN